MNTQLDGNIILPSFVWERIALDDVVELKYIKLVEWHYNWEYELDNYKTLREFLLSKYPDDEGLKNITHVILIDLKKFNIHNSSVKYNIKTNDFLGYGISDLNPRYYNRLMIHETFSYDHIKENRFLCNSGQCDISGYNEKTGVWDPKVKMNPREIIPELPGIYFTQLTLNESSIMEINSKFAPVKDLSLMYGDIGIIYTAEYLFKNYRVNLKNNQLFGYGEEVSPDEYFNLSGDEAIVRANKIPIKSAKCFLVMINYSELKFIYETFGYNDHLIEWKSVIKLYREKWKQKWFLRKSNLLKVLKTYPNNKTLPPIIIGYKKSYFEHSYYGGAFDIDSDSF